MQIKIFKNAREIKEGDIFVAKVESCEGHDFIILERAD